MDNQKNNMGDEVQSKNSSHPEQYAEKYKDLIPLLSAICGNPTHFQSGIHRFFEQRREILTNILVDQIFPKILEKSKNEHQIIKYLNKFFSVYYNNGKFRQNPQNGKEKSNKWPHPSVQDDFYFINLEQPYLSYCFQTSQFSVKFTLSRHSRLYQEGKQKGIHRPQILLSHSDFSIQNNQFREKSHQFEFHFNHRPLTPAEYNLIKNEISKNSIPQVKRITPRLIFKNNLLRIRQYIQLKSQKISKEFFQPFEEGNNEHDLLETHFARFCKLDDLVLCIHRDFKRFMYQTLDLFLQSEFNLLEISHSIFQNWEKNKKNSHLRSIQSIGAIFQIREIAREVIDILAPFEEFLLAVWKKPKLLLSTNFCITLNCLPPSTLPIILSNQAQIKWWHEHLKFDLVEYVEKIMFPSGLSKGEQNSNTLAGILKENIEQSKQIHQQLIESYPGLLLDTKFFKNSEKMEILASIGSIEEKLSGIIIKSDKFHALRLLRPRFQSKIDFCYIDPPYNTGNDTFTYNDALSRDSWLKMMRAGLENLHPLLSERGVMVTSLDDHEYHHFRLLGEQIFGEENFTGNIIWHSTKSITNTALISQAHTHNLIFMKDLSYFRSHRTEFRLPESGEGFSNPDNDPKGPWKADPFQVGGWRPNQQYEITNPLSGQKFRPNTGCSWKNDKKTFDKLMKEGRIVFGKTGEGSPMRKRYLSEAISRGRVTNTIWSDLRTTTRATYDLRDMFGKIVFSNPKPVDLLKRFIELGSSANSWIIDFFAGSGTTAHAVLELNRAGKGRRRFILVEKDDIFQSVLLSRLIKASYSSEWRQGQPNLSQLRENRQNDTILNTDAKNFPDHTEPIIFQYHEVEQFEDCFENIQITTLQPDKLNFKYKFSENSHTLNVIDSNGIHQVNPDIVHSYCAYSGLTVISYHSMHFSFPGKSESKSGSESKSETKLKSKLASRSIRYQMTLAKKPSKRVLLIWRDVTKIADLQKEKELIGPELSQFIAKFQTDEVYINEPTLFGNFKPLESELAKITNIMFSDSKK